MKSRLVKVESLEVGEHLLTNEGFKEIISVRTDFEFTMVGLVGTGELLLDSDLIVRVK